MLLTEILLQASLIIASTIGFIGVAIITYGGLQSAFFFLRCVFYRKDHVSKIRLEFGKYLALGLEFLIGKDVIETMVEPSWDELGKLASIVIIRTFITIFLSWEINEVLHEVEEEKKLL